MYQIRTRKNWERFIQYELDVFFFLYLIIRSFDTQHERWQQNLTQITIATVLSFLLFIFVQQIKLICSKNQKNTAKLSSGASPKFVRKEASIDIEFALDCVSTVKGKFLPVMELERKIMEQVISISQLEQSNLKAKQSGKNNIFRHLFQSFSLCSKTTVPITDTVHKVLICLQCSFVRKQNQSLISCYFFVCSSTLVFSFFRLLFTRKFQKRRTCR